MKKIHFYLFFSVIVLSTCSKEKSPIQKIKREIIQTHDEIMPKIEEVRQIEEELHKKRTDWTIDSVNLDSLEHIKNINNTQEAESHITKLRSIRNSMMDWMENYKEPEGNDNKVMNYLKKEKEKILLIRNSTTDALEEAESFLQKSIK